MCIISPSNATCNELIIRWSSKLYSLGSNPNFYSNSKNCSDASLQLLIFLSARSFLSYLSHVRNVVLGINSYLYFWLFGSHFFKNCCPITVIWFYMQICSTKPKILPFINSFNCAFFECFFANFNHLLLTQEKQISKLKQFLTN